MLGINRPDDHPPPVPLPPSTACSTNPHQQILQQQQQHLYRHHRHHPSLDAFSSSTSTSNSSSSSSSPSTSISPFDHHRPSTGSSLRPFPFLGGIRRKSANASASKSPHPLTHHTSSPTQSHHHSSTPSATTVTNKTKVPLIKSNDPSNRLYTHGASKKAQSVDDLSQFGLLPKQRIQPRRSEELFESRAITSKSSTPPCASSSASIDGDRQDPSNLHNGLDQIGELAGSLADIPGSSRADDRQPRLSNPRGMRTVYGVPIDDLFWRDGDAFPLLVDVLVKLIEEKGLDQQGIYRVPGEKRVIENLQASIDERGVQGVDIWGDSYKDVHNLSGALKLFLREIPGGVIPFDRYDRFLAVNAIVDEKERTTQLKAHVEDLPIPNKILLLKLIQHFERVVAHATTNSMLAHNVAIVFAPSLFRNGSEHSNPLLSMQNIGKASAIVRHFVLNASMIFEESCEDLLKQAASSTNLNRSRTSVRSSRTVTTDSSPISPQVTVPSESRRRSINMRFNHHSSSIPVVSNANSNPTPKNHSKKKEGDRSSKRASVNSILTTTTDELKKSRRGSTTAVAQKKTCNATVSSSNHPTSSRRNSSRTNSVLSKPVINPAGVGGKNRHSLTGSILSSPSTSNSSPSGSTHKHPLPPHSTHSSQSNPPVLPQLGITTPSTPTPTTTKTGGSPTSSSTPTPQPLGFNNLTVKKRSK